MPTDRALVDRFARQAQPPSTLADRRRPVACSTSDRGIHPTGTDTAPHNLTMAESNALLKAGELERLSALETLKGLSNPDAVKLGELVTYLESRGLWRQFAKITLGDLRDAFKPISVRAARGPRTGRGKAARVSVWSDTLGGDGASESESAAGDEAIKPKPKKISDGGLSTDEFGRQVLAFIEGNGEVTVEDVAEYTQLEKKVCRHHLKALVESNELESLGVGRQAIYSIVG